MTTIADLPASPLVIKAFERLANYVYDGNVGQYRDASTGRFVSYKRVYSLLDLNERANEEIMQGVTMAFQDGAVDAPHWYLAMANQQRMLTVQQAALGAGGFDNLKPADFRRIEAQLRDDFQRLHRFGRQIEAGQVSPGQAQVRVGMYAGRARTQFFKSQPMPVVKKGEMAIERRVLNPAEHCNWCLYLADLGWQPYGTLPVPCESSAVWQNGQCLTNCKCDLERRIVPIAEAKRLLSTKAFDPSAVKSAPATSAFAMAPDRFSDAECLQMVIEAAQTKHYEIACLTVNGYGSEQYTTTGGEGAAVNVEKLLKILAELHQRGSVETAHLYHTHPVPTDKADYEPFGIMHDLSIFSAAAGIGLRAMTIIDAQGRSQWFVQGSPALSGQMVVDRYNALYSQLVARFEEKQKRSPRGDDVDRLLLIVNKKICQEAGIRYRVTPIAGWSVKGGPGSGYHGHAGRPGEVGGSAPADRVNVAGLVQELSDRGMPVQVIGDVVVAQSVRFASKGKWAVWSDAGMQGNWYDTPDQAIDAWDQAQIEIAQKQEASTKRNVAIARVTKDGGAFEDWQNIVGGGKILSISRATDALRECGFGLNEAKRLANSVPIVWESGGGGQYIESLTIFEKQKRARGASATKGGPGSGYRGHAGRPGEVGGSAPAGTTLQSAEDSIRHRDKEHLYLFDRDGNMVFEAVGDAENVGIPHDVETVGAVMTHSHPVNPDNYSYAPSLSLGDLKQALEDQLQEVRAVGDRYTYSMRFSPATFGDKDFRNRVLTAYGNARAEIVDSLMLKAEAGEMTKRDVRTEAQHLANVRLAKEFPEITYTRTDAPARAVKGGPGSGYHGHAGRPGKRGGSAPADITTPVDLSKDRSKLDGALAQVESEIRIQTYETLVVLDKNGNKLDSSDGASDHVVVSDKTLSFMKGNIITHNHPSGWEFDPSEPQHAGNSFGINDLQVAFEGEVAEMRAVTPMYVFTMRPPPGGWNGDLWRDKAERVYHLMNGTVRSDFMNGINDGSLTMSEANARHYHEVCTRFAKAIGADYSRRLFYPAPEQGDA